MKNEQRFGTEGFEAGSERSEQVEVEVKYSYSLGL